MENGQWLILLITLGLVTVTGVWARYKEKNSRDKDDIEYKSVYNYKILKE